MAANSILRALSPRSVVVSQATIILNPRDPVISGALAFGLYEVDETKVFQRLCKPGMTFLDVGANVGYYTALAMRALGPKGRIVSLEPDPDSFQYLTQTIQANVGATVSSVNKAASDHAGRATLYTSADNRGDHRLYQNDLASGQCDVEVQPVDEILAGLGISQVDLVKMDVQGFEGKVIAGMQQLLTGNRRMAVIFEFWPNGLDQAGSDATALLANLRELGFDLFEIASGGSLRSLENPSALIASLPGRQYTNLVAFKGYEDVIGGFGA